MKVLLVYPEVPDTFWSYKYALKFIGKATAFPPLGLLTIAALLPSAWLKRLIDLNTTQLTAEDLAWADFALISGMTVQRNSINQIIVRCKNSGVKVIAGGPLFTSEYEQFQGVNHFVLNEAELTLPLFLSDLERGYAKRFYKTDEFADIRETPVPLWKLADLKRYACMSIQFSRGCPYQCDFCNVTALLGHRPRIKTNEQIIAELDCLYQQGWRGPVFFVDDNFIGNKKQLKTELLPALIKWQEHKVGIKFNTEASIDLTDDEPLMQMMAMAGFDTVFIGIETPDEASLAECSKKQNKNRDLIKDVKHIQRSGLQVQGGFIVGFDNDTLSTFQRQIDFIQTSGIVTAMVGLLQALPGTKLYKRLKQAGRLIGQTSGDNVDGSTNIVPRMGIEELRKGYGRMMDYLYSPPNYYRRVRMFLKDFQEPSVCQNRQRFSLWRFLIFFRVCWHLGFLKSGGRWQFWKLLILVFFHQPRLFSKAVMFTIYGHHFREVIKQHIK